ncbi:MAG: WYL domain-containing protein [Candidatus Nanopelagicales bacterium]|nr:WYL domain-containing protein [Candidatus Nanopelagicales bacterium]
MSATANSITRLSRLLALVPWLTVNDGVSVAEAANHFDVTPDQLEKDLWLLIVCGLPGHGPDQLVDIDFWDDGRIHVLDPQTLRRPLRISPAEAMSLLVALRLLAQVPGSHDRAALVSATNRLQLAVGDVDASVVLDDINVDVVLSNVSKALQENRLLNLRYGGAGGDTVTERAVEPLRLEATDGRTYLEGFCRSAGAVRTFRIDRIVEVKIGDVITATDSQVSEIRVVDMAFTARVLLQPQVRWALDVHPMRVEKEHSDGSVIASIAAHDSAWLVRLIMSLRGYAALLEPADLRNLVKMESAAALAAYDQPTPAGAPGRQDMEV